MDSARQILRYSIPGSLTLLFAVATVLATRLLWGDTLHEVRIFSGAAVGIAAIAATVPVGFVIYQMYYATYRPIYWGRRTVTRDRGAAILSALEPATQDRLRLGLRARLDTRTAHRGVQRGLGRLLKNLELDVEGLRRRYHAPDALERDDRNLGRIYRDNWHENWGAFRSLLDYASANGGEELKREFTNLSDIYHALGASRLAVFVGWLVGAGYVCLAYRTRVMHQVGASVGALLLAFLVTQVVFHVLWARRRDTWKSAERCARYGLRWCLEGEGLDGLPNSPFISHRESREAESIFGSSLFRALRG